MTQYQAQRNQLINRRAKSQLDTCPHCQGAFIHYRQCPYFQGADERSIRQTAIMSARRRLNQ